MSILSGVLVDEEVAGGVEKRLKGESEVVACCAQTRCCARRSSNWLLWLFWL